MRDQEIKFPELLELHLKAHQWDEAEAKLYYTEKLMRFKKDNPDLESPEQSFARYILNSTPKNLPTEDEPIKVQRIVGVDNSEDKKKGAVILKDEVFESLDETPEDLRSFMIELRQLQTAKFNFRKLASVVISELLRSANSSSQQMGQIELARLTEKVDKLEEEASNDPRKWTIEEQLVCLHELGILQRLKDKNPSSDNALANALAPALNRKPTSLQNKIRKYYNDVEQSEILTQERLDKVRAILSGLNIDSI